MFVILMSRTNTEHNLVGRMDAPGEVLQGVLWLHTHNMPCDSQILHAESALSSAIIAERIKQM